MQDGQKLMVDLLDHNAMTDLLTFVDTSCKPRLELWLNGKRLIGTCTVIGVERWTRDITRYSKCTVDG